MNSGWVCLHRQIIDSRVFQNAEVLKLFIWLLCRASRKERWANDQVKLKPGQLIVGRHMIAEALGWSPSTVRNRLAKLEEWDVISLQKDSRWTVVTITNYEVYQFGGDSEGQPEDRSRTTGGQVEDNGRTAGGQPEDTKQQLKQLNNENKKLSIIGKSDDQWISEIYAAYPRKEGRKAAETAIRKALRTVDGEILLASVKEYAEAKANTETQFIKQPATWFNQGCWEDDRKSWIPASEATKNDHNNQTRGNPGKYVDGSFDDQFKGIRERSKRMATGSE